MTNQEKWFQISSGADLHFKEKLNGFIELDLAIIGSNLGRVNLLMLTEPAVGLMSTSTQGMVNFCQSFSK